MRKYQIVMKKEKTDSRASSKGSQKSNDSNPLNQVRKVKLE